MGRHEQALLLLDALYEISTHVSVPLEELAEAAGMTVRQARTATKYAGVTNAGMEWFSAAVLEGDGRMRIHLLPRGVALAEDRRRERGYAEMQPLTRRPVESSATAAASHSTSVTVRADAFDPDLDQSGPYPTGSVGPLPPLPSREREDFVADTIVKQPAAQPDVVTEAEREIVLGLTACLTRALNALNKQSDEITRLREAKDELAEEIAKAKPSRSRVRERAITIEQVIKTSETVYDFLKKVYPEVMTVVLAVALYFK